VCFNSHPTRGFCNYIGDKRETRENVGPLLSEMLDPVTWDTEKAEVLDAFFATVMWPYSKKG